MKKTAAILAASLALTLGVCLLFNTPLFRYFGNSIPCSPRMTGMERRQHMVPGDSLQLLYEFLLLKDSLFGPTALFDNPYEFNAGSGADRHEPSCYSMVFSLAFALLAALAPAAAAWNMVFLLTLWLTAFFAWRLAERYTDTPALHAMAAAVAILVPYRFMALCGGRPTGFAAAWVPLLLLGLDRFVRDAGFGGACAAGLALFFMAMGDIQTFFFAALAAPAWCIVPLAKGMSRETFRWPWLRARMAPALVLAFACGISFMVIKATTRFGDSLVSKGRALSEIGLFTPHAEGLVNAAAPGISAQIYLGWPLAAIVFAAFVFLLLRLAARPGPGLARNVAVFIIMSAAVFLVVALALGPFGPFGSRLFVFARSHVPYYSMLRQTAKICALLPAFLPLLLVAGFHGALGPRPRPAAAWLAAALAAGALAADYQRLFRPMACELAGPSPAYAALVADSLGRGEAPRALAVPLWPGDHHSGSIYQYFAVTHRVRMLNGYRPTVPRAYLESVFRPFESLNHGVAGDEQMDSLLARGVRHIVFHEELYSERIAPFPGCLALDRLLGHPRLALLAQDNTIRVFSILPKQAARKAAPDIKPLNPILMPRLPVFTDNLATCRVDFAAAPGTALARFAALKEPGAWLETPEIPLAYPPAARWLVRARGSGSLAVAALNRAGPGQPADAAANEPHATWTLAAGDWEWQTLPAAIDPPPFGAARLRVELLEGSADVDAIVLAAGAPWEFPPGGKLSWTAREAFHTSESVPETGEVLVKSGRTREGAVLEAIHWPLEPGRYRVTLRYSSREPAMRLGGFVLEGRGLEPEFTHADVSSTNSSVTIDATQTARMPLTATLHYAGRGNFTAESIEIERLAGAPDASDQAPATATPDPPAAGDRR